MHRLAWVGVLYLFTVAVHPASALPPPTYNNVAFGTGALQNGGSVSLKMDIWRPAGATGATPVLLWIHEGAWMGGSFETLPSYVDPILQQGISIASVEYRLSGQNVFPTQIHDVKGAVRFLRANASTYGIDPLRMASWGWSAGGHLSLLLGTSGGVAAAEGNIGGNLNQSSRVLASASYAGPTDLLNMAPDVTTPPGNVYNHDAYDSPPSQLIGFDSPGQGMGVLRANLTNPASPYPHFAAMASLANPITHVTFDDPITFIAHSIHDNQVPVKQGHRIRDALLAANVRVVQHFLTSASTNHDVFGTTANSAVIQFLAAELKREFGDSSRDGIVDIRDLKLLSENWLQPGGWAQGDFNSDGFVDRTDLGMMLREWEGGALSSALSAYDLPLDAVPEPGVAVSIAVAFLVMTHRFRASRGNSADSH